MLWLQSCIQHRTHRHEQWNREQLQSVSPSTGGNTNQVITRIDQNINSTTRLFGRYAYYGLTDLPTDPYGTGFCADRCAELYHTKVLAIDLNHQFSSTTIFDLNVAASRFVYARAPINSGYRFDTTGLAGKLQRCARLHFGLLRRPRLLSLVMSAISQGAGQRDRRPQFTIQLFPFDDFDSGQAHHSIRRPSRSRLRQLLPDQHRHRRFRIQRHLDRLNLSRECHTVLRSPTSFSDCHITKALRKPDGRRRPGSGSNRRKAGLIERFTGRHLPDYTEIDPQPRPALRTSRHMVRTVQRSNLLGSESDQRHGHWLRWRTRFNLPGRHILW